MLELSCQYGGQGGRHYLRVSEGPNTQYTEYTLYDTVSSEQTAEAIMLKFVGLRWFPLVPSL